MYKNELALYQKAEKMTDSPRETEARVLTHGAQKLRFCMERWESEERDGLLSEALRYNQRIWSIFQADLTSPESVVPEDLKRNLLKLGAFVDRQIFTIMAFPSPDKLEPIIRVNLGLATGLRKKTAPLKQPVQADTETGTREIEITG